MFNPSNFWGSLHVGEGSLARRVGPVIFTSKYNIFSTFIT